jgi:ferrochelatase
VEFMTPLDFLRWYEHDEWHRRGDCYSTAPLEVEEGDRVGVVLMNLGGPDALEDVEPFLYHLLMDPALLDLPVGGTLRHGACRALAAYRAEAVQREYELIGGSSPLARLTHEQARSLEQYLNDHFGVPTGVEFGTYAAMRHWRPFSEEAAQRMAEDGVDKVLLLPLYPQYSEATSGSSLAYWAFLEEKGEIPSWPTTAQPEYAVNPKYIQALSERIDEGLQRFPKGRRADVELLFNAPGPPLRAARRRDDPYCCHVHATVERVMQYRDHDRPVHTGFQNRIGLRRGLAPSTPDRLEALAREGVGAVLVVPLTFATDHLLTSYGLDIDVRQQAEAAGLTHFEVTSPLNTHPLFIEALGEATIAQLNLPVDVNQLRVGGDGLAQDYPLRPFGDRPRLDPAASADRCDVCDEPPPARRWVVSDDVPDSDAIRAGEGADVQDPAAPSSGSSA